MTRKPCEIWHEQGDAGMVFMLYSPCMVAADEDPIKLEARDYEAARVEAKKRGYEPEERAATI